MELHCINFTSDFYLFVSVFTLLRSVNGSTCLSWSILLYMMMKNSVLHTYLFLFICLGTGISWIITCREENEIVNKMKEIYMEPQVSILIVPRIVLSKIFC
jgi:hypothetical protein